MMLIQHWSLILTAFMSVVRRKVLVLKKAFFPVEFVPEQEIIAKGYPAYTTSAGWIGYTDSQLRELCQKYLKAGWTRLVL